MLNIELEMLLETERRNDWISEAERYRLAKIAQAQLKQSVEFSLTLAFRSYSTWLQAVARFLPFNTNPRQRPAAVINPG